MTRPTKAQLSIWQRLRELGCIICRAFDVQIHHIETGMGGRKNHDRVIPLCVNHHTGEQGIHKIGRKKWQALYGMEAELLEQAMGEI